ncbi:hypothetical protein [Actinoplanes sp. NPDC026670]|uniref:hypothetical protein n=1 Tax=Actinoplanes sp. NPDC026670 TaxID=3154700 RepID=UPI0033DE260F
MIGDPAADPGPAAYPDIHLHPPVSLASAHLLDGDLLAPTVAGSKHLVECGWCQQRQQAADRHHGDDLDDAAFLQAARHRAMTAGAAVLGPLTRLTPALHELTRDTDVREPVTVGQLWRLRREQATELAVIVAVDQWWVTVAPVTTDLAAADEFSLLLPASATPLNVALAVCVSLDCTVPMLVLDTLIAPAGRPGLTQQMPAPQTLRDVWRAWRRGEPTPAGPVYGTALDEGDLDRRELRDAVATGFAPLIGASAAIPGSDPLSEVTPLAQRVRDRGLRPSQMARETGLPMEVFTRIGRDGRVTPNEAGQLAPLLGLDRTTVLAANPPLDDDLITEVSQPGYRRGLRRLAAATCSTEDDQRWLMAQTVAPIASRTVTGRDPEPAAVNPWTDKVQDYLRAKLAELDDQP